MDYSLVSFFIRRMDTKGFLKAPDVPAASIPLVSFVYLTDGELLFECGGESLLCYAGQLILVPQGQAFSIPYYKDCTGYTGVFSASFLPDARVLQDLARVVHKAFWFDDAVFVGELFNMLALAFERGDETFAAKGLDLLLHMAKLGRSGSRNPLVSRFIELLFDKQAQIKSGNDYAQECNVSLNWLNRNVKRHTGRSVSSWIEAARISRAKRLLQDTALPVIDVASAVGFDDQSYFSRFFRQRTGLTPREYRAAAKK